MRKHAIDDDDNDDDDDDDDTYLAPREQTIDLAESL